MDHLSSEGNAFPHNPSLLPRVFHSQSPSPAPISQLIGVDGKSIITCSHCKDVREKDNLIHVIDLVYSRKVSKDITPPERMLTTGISKQLNNSLWISPLSCKTLFFEL